MKKIIRKILSYFKKDKNSRLKDFDDIIPYLVVVDILYVVANDIVKGKDYIYIDKYILKNCYFAGSTLCIDVKIKNSTFEDIIIINTKKKTIDLFVTKCKRRNLSVYEMEMLEKVIKMRKK